MDERVYLHKPGLMSARARGVLLLFVCTLAGPLRIGVMPQVKGSVRPPGSGVSPGGMVGVKATAEEAINRHKERIFSPQDVLQVLGKDWQLPPLHPLHEHPCRRSPWLMRIQSKPFRVISGNRTQVGACYIYFVLLFKASCPSLPSYVAGVMGASSCGPAETKWKTSQRKQERSWARTSHRIGLREGSAQAADERTRIPAFRPG